MRSSRRVVTVGFDRPEEAQRLVQQVVHAQVVPGAIEVERPAEGPGTVAVLLDGIEAGVAGRTATTLRLLGSDAREGL